MFFNETAYLNMNNRYFAQKFDELGEMSMREYPDIDVQKYIFDFENVNGTSDEELDKIHDEISDHMEEFSKVQSIEKIFHYRCIWL